MSVTVMEINSGLDRQDQDSLLLLEAHKERIEAEFVRHAEKLGVEPPPIVHVHEEHEVISRRGLGTAFMSAFGGLVVAWLLTMTSVQNKLVGGALGVLVFVVATLVLELGGFVVVDDALFIKRVRWFWLGPLTVFMLSISVLLVSRVASPDLADVLLEVMPFAWYGMETALLLLTAVASVTYWRFGWSGRLMRRYTVTQQEIQRLNRNIERRHRPGSSGAMKLAALCVAVILLSHGRLHAQAPTIMEDCTGSVADLTTIEQRITVGVLESDAAGIDLIRFSAHPFAADVMQLRWQMAVEGPNTVPINDANLRRQRARARALLEAAFQPQVPPAQCTSVPDMIARAAGGPKPVLLVTDAVHDCRPATDTTVVAGKDVYIVIVRSKYDTGSDSEEFKRKKRLIERYIRDATILPEYRLNEGIANVVKPWRDQPNVLRRVDSGK